MYPLGPFRTDQRFDVPRHIFSLSGQACLYIVDGISFLVGKEILKKKATRISQLIIKLNNELQYLENY